MAKIDSISKRQRSASELMTNVSKSKINLSSDPTEYNFNGIQHRTINVFCLLELLSYFTLQLEETADSV